MGSAPWVRAFRLPRGAERYVLLQRTSLGLRLPARLRGSHVARLYDRYASSAVERVRRPTIARRFTADIVAEYRRLRSSLPESADAILDIGAGIGGIDVLLYRHFADAGESPMISLLDKEGISDDVFYGFREHAAHYNSFELTREFLTLNGVPTSSIETLDAERDGFPAGHTYDVVVSLHSWGHHYPISAYLEEVEAVLSARGVAFLDVRRGSDGMDVLREWFSRVELLASGRVSDRVVLSR